MASAPLPNTAEDKPAEEEARPQKKNYVPEGFESVEAFLADAKEIYKLDREADQHNIDAAIDDLKFVSCDIDGNGQWDTQVLADRRQLGQPSPTNNTLPQYTGQVIGDRRMNQTSIKVLPREDGDVDKALIRSDLIRNIEVQSRAERVYSQAFEHEVTCGIGNFRVELDWTDDDVFDRDIFIRPIPNPLSVVWDYMSIDPTGRDAEHCFVDDLMPRKQYEKAYPDTPAGDFAEGDRSEGWLTDDTVRVTEYWRMVERDRVIALMQDGRVLDITEKDPAEYAHDLFTDEQGPRIREVKCKYAQMHLVTGFAILEGPYELKINRLPVIRCSGREIPVGDKRVRFGLIRFIKDNQRLLNVMDGIKLELLSKAPRQQWFGPDNAFQGYENEFRMAHISGDPILKYNSKASAPPQPVPPVQYPAAFAQESAIQNERMRQGTGIYEASLGAPSNEKSGVAIQARQSEGDVATVVYHDNMNAAIQEAGDVINQLIPQVYDVARTIRVIGNDQEERLVRINDPGHKDSVDLSTGKYDVTISTGPAFQTKRQEASAAMMEAVRVFPPLMQIAGPEIIKGQDWPNAEAISEILQDALVKQGMREPEQDDDQAQDADPMAQMAQQQAQMAAQAQQMQMQFELQKGQAEARQAEANALKAEADAQKAQIEAQRAEMEMHAGVGHHLDKFSGVGQPDPTRQPQTGKRDPARQPGRQKGRR